MPVATSPTEATRSLADRFRSLTDVWSRSLVRIVRVAAAFADSAEWVVAGSPTAAHHLAAIADVDVATVREWIRIGRQLRTLPASADAFASGDISYSKLRTLTRVATPDNERELLEIARDVPAGDLGRALAAWMGRNCDPEDLDAHQQRRRAIRERVEPDGTTTVTMSLPPLVAGAWSAALTTLVMRNTRHPGHASAGAWPTLAQQKVDALHTLLTEGGSGSIVEVVLHVRGDGCTLDDGTPIPESVVERVAPDSFLRALIHDAESRPVNASGRQRHPTTRQKRVVTAREPACRDCGRTDLLVFDHVPSYEESHHTLVEELEVRCSPCHRRRHAS
jgi:hypothetical protein